MRENEKKNQENHQEGRKTPWVFSAEKWVIAKCEKGGVTIHISKPLTPSDCIELARALIRYAEKGGNDERTI